MASNLVPKYGAKRQNKGDGNAYTGTNFKDVENIPKCKVQQAFARLMRLIACCLHTWALL